MLRQGSAPLWNEVLNNGDPHNLGKRLTDGDITYERAVEEARERYLKEQKKRRRRKKRGKVVEKDAREKKN